MGQNLGPLNIKDTYQSLVQISGSILTDGSGSAITSITDITASYATSASHALYADNAGAASTATSASHAVASDTAISASHAVNADNAISASFATTASYALNVPVTASYAVSASHANNADSSLTSTSASYATSASHADISDFASSATSASFATTALLATSASHAVASDTSISASHAVASDTSISASYATTASFALNVTTPTLNEVTAQGSSSSATIYADGGIVTQIITPYLNTNLDLGTIGTGDINITSAGGDIIMSGSIDSHNGITAPTINATSITASGANFTTLTATSASIGFLQTVTGSATIIGDAFIILNTGDAQRYAGLIVEDSGSATPNNYTASLFFDSLLNDWNYEYSGSDPTNFGVVMFGPEYGTKGSPTYLTNNRLAKGDGSHHLNDSNISDDGTTVSINSNVEITGSLSVLSGSESGTFVDNIGTPTASLAVKHIVSLTQAEYNALTPDVNTYYVITDSTLSTFTNISASGWVSASYFVGDGSQLTGIATDPFPYTGSAGISGSLELTGSVFLQIAGLTNEFLMLNPDEQLGFRVQGGAYFGDTNFQTDNGYVNFMAGERNVINGAQTSFIGGARENTINNQAENAAIIGGKSNTLGASRSTIQASLNSTLTHTGVGQSDLFSAIIAGQSHNLDGYSGSVILGGNGIIADAHDTIYVPNLHLTGSTGGNLIFADGTTQTTAAVGTLLLSGSTYYATDQTLTNYSENVIIGNGATNTGTNNATAIGKDAKANGGAVAIGNSAYASGSGGYTNMVAIGNNARSEAGSVAIGNTAQAGFFGTAIGDNANISGASTSVAFGRNTLGNNGNHTIIGYESQATGSGQSVVVGRVSKANGNHSTILGSNALASTDYSLALGSGAQATGSLAMDVRVNDASLMTATTASQDVTFTAGVNTNGESSFNGDLHITGSVNGNVSSLLIGSNTGSIDCSAANFFDITLVSGSDTLIEATNLQPGQTINLKVLQPGIGYGTISFSGDFAFPSGTSYTGSAASNAVDIVSMISFDSSKLYANKVENLV